MVAAVDGAVDTAAVERLVGGVDDGVDLQGCDVGLEDLDASGEGGGHSGILHCGGMESFGPKCEQGASGPF